MIYTHVLKLGGGAVRSPLDMLRATLPQAEQRRLDAVPRFGPRRDADGDVDHHPGAGGTGRGVREEPCCPYRVTPNSTAAAISAS